MLDTFLDVLIWAWITYASIVGGWVLGRRIALAAVRNIGLRVTLIERHLVHEATRLSRDDSEGALSLCMGLVRIGVTHGVPVDVLVRGLRELYATYDAAKRGQ